MLLRNRLLYNVSRLTFKGDKVNRYAVIDEAPKEEPINYYQIVYRKDYMQERLGGIHRPVHPSQKLSL